MTATPTLFTRVLGFSVQGDIGPWTFYTNKNRKLVWFPQAPPLTPPTYAQFARRNAMSAAAVAWRNLPDDQQANWRKACRKARLECVGFGLFYYWRTKQDASTIATIEMQTGIALLTDEAKNGL